MALRAAPQILTHREEQPNDAELIARYIAEHPQKRGQAYVYLPDHGHSVAALVRDPRQNGGNIAETAASWDVPEDAVHAVLAFYHRYREAIDARIVIEDDQFVDRYWFSAAFGPR